MAWKARDVRLDNGPEYVRSMGRMSVKASHCSVLHPLGQAAAERLYRAIQSDSAPLSSMLCINCRATNEWRGINIFQSIQEVQDYATHWLWTYYNPSRDIRRMPCRAVDRPNMGIGGITPAQKLKMAA